MRTNAAPAQRLIIQTGESLMDMDLDGHKRVSKDEVALALGEQRRQTEMMAEQMPHAAAWQSKMLDLQQEMYDFVDDKYAGGPGQQVTHAKIDDAIDFLRANLTGRYYALADFPDTDPDLWGVEVSKMANLIDQIVELKPAADQEISNIKR